MTSRLYGPSAMKEGPKGISFSSEHFAGERCTDRSGARSPRNGPCENRYHFGMTKCEKPERNGHENEEEHPDLLYRRSKQHFANWDSKDVVHKENSRRTRKPQDDLPEDRQIQEENTKRTKKLLEDRLLEKRSSKENRQEDDRRVLHEENAKRSKKPESDRSLDRQLKSEDRHQSRPESNRARDRYSSRPEKDRLGDRRLTGPENGQSEDRYLGKSKNDVPDERGVLSKPENDRLGDRRLTNGTSRNDSLKRDKRSDVRDEGYVGSLTREDSLKSRRHDFSSDDVNGGRVASKPDDENRRDSSVTDDRSPDRRIRAMIERFKSREEGKLRSRRDQRSPSPRKEDSDAKIVRNDLRVDPPDDDRSLDSSDRGKLDSEPRDISSARSKFIQESVRYEDEGTVDRSIDRRSRSAGMYEDFSTDKDDAKRSVRYKVNQVSERYESDGTSKGNIDHSSDPQSKYTEKYQNFTIDKDDATRSVKYKTNHESERFENDMKNGKVNVDRGSDRRSRSTEKHEPRSSGRPEKYRSNEGSVKYENSTVIRMNMDRKSNKHEDHVTNRPEKYRTKDDNESYENGTVIRVNVDRSTNRRSKSPEKRENHGTGRHDRHKSFKEPENSENDCVVRVNVSRSSDGRSRSAEKHEDRVIRQMEKNKSIDESGRYEGEPAIRSSVDRSSDRRSRSSEKHKDRCTDRSVEREENSRRSTKSKVNQSPVRYENDSVVRVNVDSSIDRRSKLTNDHEAHHKVSEKESRRSEQYKVGEESSRYENENIIRDRSLDRRSRPGKNQLIRADAVDEDDSRRSTKSKLNQVMGDREDDVVVKVSVDRSSDYRSRSTDRHADHSLEKDGTRKSDSFRKKSDPHNVDKPYRRSSKDEDRPPTKDNSKKKTYIFEGSPEDFDVRIQRYERALTSPRRDLDAPKRVAYKDPENNLSRKDSLKDTDREISRKSSFRNADLPKKSSSKDRDPGLNRRTSFKDQDSDLPRKSSFKHNSDPGYRSSSRDREIDLSRKSSFRDESSEKFGRKNSFRDESSEKFGRKNSFKDESKLGRKNSPREYPVEDDRGAFKDQDTGERKKNSFKDQDVDGGRVSFKDDDEGRQDSFTGYDPDYLKQLEAETRLRSSLNEQYIEFGRVTFKDPEDNTHSRTSSKDRSDETNKRGSFRSRDGASRRRVSSRTTKDRDTPEKKSSSRHLRSLTAHQQDDVEYQDESKNGKSFPLKSWHENNRLFSLKYLKENSKIQSKPEERSTIEDSLSPELKLAIRDGQRYSELSNSEDEEDSTNPRRARTELVKANGLDSRSPRNGTTVIKIRSDDGQDSPNVERRRRRRVVQDVCAVRRRIYEAEDEDEGDEDDVETVEARRWRFTGEEVAPGRIGSTPSRTLWNYREGGVLITDVEEGQPCLQCSETCTGFSPHSWRKNCTSCKCPREAHDVCHEEWVSVRSRLGLKGEESNGPIGTDPRARGLAWAPSGLPPHKVEEYFSMLPEISVPRLGTSGERHRDRQLAYQLPKQDLARAYCRHLDPKHASSADDFMAARNEIALDIGTVKEVLERDVDCGICHEPLTYGSLAVSASKLGLLYHPACFRCTECQELLVDLAYCVHDDALFCERHYAEQLKPRCAACDELIFSGEYTKAMNKDWHSGHFCCWQCDESLTGQRYVLRDEHPYCIKCYESVFANGCEECNKIIGIDSKDLSYKDKHWHEACFLCNRCRVSLVDKQFGSKVDKIYCGNCYDAQFASRCDGCGEIFRAGTKKMEYKTRQWHEKCFCCCVCKNAIGTKSFIPREQEIYCAACYEDKFATRCVKCNKIITSGGVTYKNEPWHRDCFTCSHCNNSLAGQRFTSRDDKPYCADCFGELFAKRCTACTKPITGIGGTRFISFEDRHWHNDCFICAGCKTSLVGRGFITDADDIICPECAKQKLM